MDLPSKENCKTVQGSETCKKRRCIGLMDECANRRCLAKKKVPCIVRASLLTVVYIPAKRPSNILDGALSAWPCIHPIEIHKLADTFDRTAHWQVCQLEQTVLANRDSDVFRGTWRHTVTQKQAGLSVGPIQVRANPWCTLTKRVLRGALLIWRGGMSLHCRIIHLRQEFRGVDIPGLVRDRIVARKAKLVAAKPLHLKRLLRHLKSPIHSLIIVTETETNAVELLRIISVQLG